MFTKTKTTDNGAPGAPAAAPSGSSVSASPAPKPAASPAAPAKPKTAPSILSADLSVKGNLSTTGDVQVDCTVDGDVHAHVLTVGEGATIRGEIVADDIVVNGRVIGRVRGLKVRLTATAKVEGDIIHKTIAIESGAHFEGSVHRQDDPLNAAGTASKSAKAAE